MRSIKILLTVLICILAGAGALAQSKKRSQPKKQASSAKQAQPKKGAPSKKQARPVKEKAAKKKPEANRRAQSGKQARRTKDTPSARRARPQQAPPVVRAKPEYRATPPDVYDTPPARPAYTQTWPRTNTTGNIVVLPQLVNPNNFSPTRRPNFVIIHHTGQKTCDETLLAFSLPQAEVSSHYLVCRDGTVYQVLSDSLRAQHAGVGRWGSITDMNSCSIGIELDNNGREPFYDAQIAGLLGLLGQLKTRYAIPAANFIGHGDYAPGRKSDPSVMFPWKLLADQGFGRWYGQAYDSAPIGFDWAMAMRAIGYDTRDSVAAIRAFKRHFMQDESGEPINDADQRVLFQLSR